MDVSPINAGNIEINQDSPSYYPFISTITNGESVTVKAVAEPGYRFEYWEGDLAGSTNPVNLTIDSNKSITAYFSRETPELTIHTSGEGSTQPAKGSYEFSYGAVIDISAIPDSGWEFDGWTGNVPDIDSNKLEIIMDSDKDVTANFIQIMYTLYMSTNGNGSTSLKSGNFTYAEGTVVDIVAIPDKGWQFDGWTGNVPDTDSDNINLLMDSDKEITANFSKLKLNQLLIVLPLLGCITIGVVVWFVIKPRIRSVK